MLLLICWILLIALGSAIAYQDFKAREINLILLLGYGVLCSYRYIQETNYIQYFANLLFTGVYLLFIFLVLTVYFFIRKGKWINIIDSQIGAGDIILFICVGACLEPAMLINFFTACFIFSLGVYFIFFRGRTIPLAGLTAVFYLLFLPVQFYLTGIL